MSERMGHRGYIGSRQYSGENPPQHVQNLVVRDFCARNGFTYLLSATEYAMPGCYMILHDLVEEAQRRAGIVCYSIFMLPASRPRRTDLCRRILGHGATLHGAVENIHVRTLSELEDLELLWSMRSQIVSSTSATQIRAAVDAGLIDW